MGRLQGKTILLVEDEPIVAMLVDDMLSMLGVEVVGPAGRLEEALSLAREGTFDAAVLDVKLGSHTSGSVADVLKARGIPYVLATGFDAPPLAEFGTGAPVLNKPYLQEDLERALLEALAASPIPAAGD